MQPSASAYAPPRLIFWESTAGCNLACIHCRRITVSDQLLPQDLTTQEAFELIDQVAAFARPIFILSGGEPLYRPDIFDIARHATEAGLIVALATNGTLIDDTVAKHIAESGIRRVSVSFDGADAPTHNIFRGPGAFEKSLAGMEHLRTVGVPYQINTTVARHNIHQMPETLALAKGLGAAALHLFLLVPVGCGMEIAADKQISPTEYENVLHWLYDAEMEGGIELKATCAPHYFRVVRQRQAEERRQGIVRERPQSMHRQSNAGGGHPGGHPGAANGGSASGDAAMRAVSKGCLAGTGVCFASALSATGAKSSPAAICRWKRATSAISPFRKPGKAPPSSPNCATRPNWVASAASASSPACVAAAGPEPTAQPSIIWARNPSAPMNPANLEVRLL